MTFNYNTKFVIIVPVYNTASYLLECLNSLLNLQYKNFTVFIVDDGSTDDSWNIISKFTKQDHRFVAQKKKNGGVSSARNFALDLIEKDSFFDAICFVDSDDVVNCNLLNIYAEGIEKYGAEFVALGVEAFNKKGVLKNKDKVMHSPLVLTGEDIFSFVFATRKFKDRRSPAASLFIGNVAFNLKTVKKMRFDESKLKGEDQHYILRALLRVQKAVAFSEIGYKYRLRNSSLSHDPLVSSSDLQTYLKLIKNESMLPSTCYQVIELRAFDAWWQTMRISVEKKEFDDRWDFFVETFNFLKENCKTKVFSNSALKKRVWIFHLGKKVVKFYFRFRINKTSSEKLRDAFP